MAFVKLTLDNVTRFVDEINVSKLSSLKRDFGAEIELDAEGAVKKYTAEDVQKVYSRTAAKTSVEDIFGVSAKPNTKK